MTSVARERRKDDDQGRSRNKELDSGEGALGGMTARKETSEFK